MPGPLLAEAYSEARLEFNKFRADAERMAAYAKKVASDVERDLKFSVDVDDAAARATLARFEADTKAMKRRLEADAVDLRAQVEADAADAYEAGAIARTSLEEGFGTGDLQIVVDVNNADAFQAGAVARAAVQEGFGAGDLVIGVDVDLGEALTAGAVARAAVEEGYGGQPLPARDAEVNLDTTRFDADYTAVAAALKLLTARPWVVQFDADTAAALAKIEAVKAAALDLTRDKFDIDFDVDTAAAARAAAAAREDFDDAFGDSDATTRINADGEQFYGVIFGLNRDLARLRERAENIRFSADGDAVRREATRIRADLQSILGDTFLIRTELGDTETRIGLTTLQAMISDLDRDVARIRTEVVGSNQAIGELTAVASAEGLVDRDILIRVEVDRASLATSGRLAERAGRQIAEAQATAQASVARAAAQERLSEQVREQAEAYREAARAATLDARRATSEANRLRRVAAGARGTFEKREKARAAEDRAQELRAVAQDLRQRTRLLAAAAREEANNTRAALARARIDDRTVSIRTRLEGVAQTLAGLGAVDVAAARVDRDIEIDVRTVGVAGAVSAIVRDLAPIRRALSGDRGQRGALGLDVEDVRRFFRTIPGLADAAAARVRSSFSRNGGQGGIDLRAAAGSVERFFRTIPALGDTAAQRVRRSFSNLVDEVKVEVGTRGVPGAIRQLVAVRLAAIAASRDVDINVDVDRRGGLARGLSAIGRFAASAVRLAAPIIAGLGGIGATVAAGLTGAVGVVGAAAKTLADTVVGAFQGVRDAVQSIQDAFPIIGEVGKAAVGAIGAAGLPTLIVGAIANLAGPVIAGVGGLVGAAIGFLVSSAVAGLASVGLPIAAIVFDETAKERLKALLAPLKTVLLSEFAGITNLITRVIAPSFATALQKLIPIAADVAGELLLPISNSLLNIVDRLGPTIQNITGPMGEGIASVLDTLARFLPAFDRITLAVGPPLTDALNAILEVTIMLADVFRSDIGSGFQVIADLIREMGPSLAAVGDGILPVVQLIGALILSVVEAGAMIRENLGSVANGVIQDLIGELPTITTLIAGAGAAVVVLARLFTSLLPPIKFVAGLLTTVGGLLTGIVGGIQKVIGVAVAGFGDLLDLIVSGFAGFLDILGRIPGLDFLGGISDKVQGFADNLSAASDSAFQWGDSTLNAAGSMLELGGALGVGAFGVGEFGSALGENRAALEDGRLSVRSYGLELDALRARHITGQITTSEYAQAISETVIGAEQVAARFPSASAAISDFSKRLSDGSLAASQFIDNVKRDLPTATDFLIDPDADPAEAVKIETIDIQAALNARGYMIAAENTKTRKLLALSNAGFDPLADFLADLDPAQVASSIEQLGGIGSQKMAEANRQVELQVIAGTVSVQSLLQERGEAIRLEAEKAGRLLTLEQQGFGQLAGQLAGLDPATFKAAIENLFAGGLAAVVAANDEARNQTVIAAEAARAEAERAGLAAQREAGERARATAGEIRQAFTSESGAGLGELLTRVGGADTGGGVPVDEARAAGDAAGGAYRSAYQTAVTGLSADVSGVIAGVREAEPDWSTAGTDSGQAYIDGLTDRLAAIPATDITGTLAGSFDPTPFGLMGTAAGAAFVGSLQIHLLNQMAFVLSTVSLIGGALGGGASIAWSEAGRVLGFTFIAAAITQITTNAAFIVAAANLIGVGLGAALTAGVQAQLGALTGVIQAAILAAIAATLAVARLTGVALGTSFNAGVSTTISGPGALLARAAATAVALGLLLTLSTWASSGRLAGQTFGLSAAGGIAATAASVSAAARAVGAAAGGALLSGAIVATIGLGPALRSIILSALSGLAPSARAEGFALGVAFADGMNAGMNAGLARVRSTAVALAEGIAASVRQALGVRSPSRVMFAIGEQVAEGLALGMERSTGRVMAASIGLAAQLPQQVTAAATSAQAVYNSASTSTQIDRSMTQNNTWNVNGAIDPLAYARRTERLMRDQRPR